MKLNQLEPRQLTRRLRGPGLDLRIGPFVLRLQTHLRHVEDAVALLYNEFPVEQAGFADFHVRIDPPPPPGLRRWVRPQAAFYFEGRMPFTPFPRRLALPLLEWGINWCIMTHAHQYLMVHSAVIAHGERAAIMPAPPGSGKSTLCAALIHRGWRLFSDELALIRPEDRQLAAIPRPINLKENSIELIRAWAPEARFGPLLSETRKGVVAHLRPPAQSVAQAGTPAIPAWVIFPRYQAGAPPQLTPLSKARTLLRLADNAFNYSVLGVRGFNTLADVIDTCDGYEFIYSNLDDAVTTFDGLAGEAR